MELNNLEYYPRFVFNCNDGRCFATDDLDLLEHFKIAHTDKIDSLQTGNEITIKWTDLGSPVKYIISKIDIRDIRYDSEEKLYGVNEDDCSSTTTNKNKFHLMSIFVFLESIDKDSPVSG